MLLQAGFAPQHPLLFVIAFLGICAIWLLLTVMPVKMAAMAVGAKRTGFIRCLAAVIATSILETLGLIIPILGSSLVAFLLASWGFAKILETTFLRGIVLGILHAIFYFLLCLVVALTLGLSLAGLALFGAGA